MARAVTMPLRVDPGSLFSSLLLLLELSGYHLVSRLGGQAAARSLFGSQRRTIRLRGILFSVPATPGDLGVIFDCVADRLYETVPEFIPRDGDICVDIGANIGACTALWASRNPSGKILAIEPHPASFQRLQENVRLNGWTHIECIHAAASSASGSIEIGMTQESSMAVVGRKAFDQAETVPALTLDRLLEERGITRVDLCKIDVEGHEVEVLKGAFGTLSHIRRLIIEFHSPALRDEVRALLIPRFDVVQESANRIGLLHAVNREMAGSGVG